MYFQLTRKFEIGMSQDLKRVTDWEEMMQNCDYWTSMTMAAKTLAEEVIVYILNTLYNIYINIPLFMIKVKYYLFGTL